MPTIHGNSFEKESNEMVRLAVAIDMKFKHSSFKTLLFDLIRKGKKFDERDKLIKKLEEKVESMSGSEGFEAHMLLQHLEGGFLEDAAESAMKYVRSKGLSVDIDMRPGELSMQGCKIAGAEHQSSDAPESESDSDSWVNGNKCWALYKGKFYAADFLKYSGDPKNPYRVYYPEDHDFRNTAEIKPRVDDEVPEVGETAAPVRLSDSVLELEPGPARVAPTGVPRAVDAEMQTGDGTVTLVEPNPKPAEVITAIDRRRMVTSLAPPSITCEAPSVPGIYLAVALVVLLLGGFIGYMLCRRLAPKESEADGSDLV